MGFSGSVTAKSAVLRKVSSSLLRKTVYILFILSLLIPVDIIHYSPLRVVQRSGSVPSVLASFSSEFSFLAKAHSSSTQMLAIAPSGCSGLILLSLHCKLAALVLRLRAASAERENFTRRLTDGILSIRVFAIWERRPSMAVALSVGLAAEIALMSFASAYYQRKTQTFSFFYRFLR